MPVTPLRFTCAKTVSKLHLFEPLRLLFERKQVPQIVVIVRIRRKTTEPLEATRLLWAQGVRSSNLLAPTIFFASVRRGTAGAVVRQIAVYISETEYPSASRPEPETCGKTIPGFWHDELVRSFVRSRISSRPRMAHTYRGSRLHSTAGIRRVERGDGPGDS